MCRKITNKYFLLTLSLALFAVTGMHAETPLSVENTSTGSKEVEAYIDLTSFDEICSDVVANICIVQSDQSRIVAKGPEQIISHIEAKVKEGVLRITVNKKLRMQNGESLSLTVYTPTLCRIHQIGVGSIKCSDRLDTPMMEIVNDGVGSVQIKDLHCDTLTVVSNGVGGIDLDGCTKAAVYKSDGVGSIKAYGMESEYTQVKLNGVGSIQCHASKQLDARNNGVGSIRYRGNPESTNIHTDGVGTIRHK